MRTQEEQIEFLKGRFKEVLKLVGANSSVQADFYFGKILRAYQEPHRHYNTLEHLCDLFDMYDQLEKNYQEFTHGLDPAFENPAAVQLAIFYHRLVHRTDTQQAYDKNESESAERAYNDLFDLGVDIAMRIRVMGLIKVTKNHVAPPFDHDEKSFCDMSLAVLAGDEQRYRAYQVGIFNELGHFPEFKAARTKFLKDKLSQTIRRQPRIFQDDYFHQSCDAKARENMAAELAVIPLYPDPVAKGAEGPMWSTVGVTSNMLPRALQPT